MSIVLTHGGLVHKYPQAKLRSLWAKAAPRLGYSPVVIRYVHELIGLTSKQDYEPETICAVFYGTGKLSSTISMSQRSINRSERELLQDKWISKTCSKRGPRNGEREKNGSKKIKWAAGINLGPLIDRVNELQQTADEVALENDAMEVCRNEINVVRRQLIDSGFENEALEAYPRGRPVEVRCFEKLKAILSALRAVYNSVLAVARQPNCPTGPAKTVGPNTIEETKSIDSTANEAHEFHKPHVDLSVLEFVATEDLKQAIGVYSQSHDPLGALSLACRDRCSVLGISDERWVLTKKKFGVPKAALFIAVIDRNSQRADDDPYCVRDAQKCLSGMAYQSIRGRMNLTGMIAEIKKSSERCRTRKKKSKVTLLATPPHLVREGMLRSFPSTPTKLRAVDDVVSQGGCHG